MVKDGATKRLEPTPLVRDYINRLRRHLLSITIFPAVSVLFLVVLLFVIFNQDASQWIVISVAIVASALVFAGSFIVYRAVAHGVYELLRAIAFVSDELIDGSVPNPHDEKNVRSGLGHVLTKVFQFSSLDKRQSPDQQAASVAPLNRMRGALAAIDTDNKILFASKNTPLYTKDDQQYLQLLFGSSDNLENWLDQCRHSSIKSSRLWRRVPNLPSNDDDRRLFDVFASYEKSANYETVVTLVDMTEIYQIDEDDLNFVAFAAHELRGPITVIRGYIDVLLEELQSQLVDDQAELFDRLTVSANRLSDYINNILNTSQYDRRHLSLELRPISLLEVYSGISDDLEMRAKTAHRKLSVELPDTLPKIAADRSSLSEVISNLIDNAIKYSYENGTIELTASSTKDQVSFTVTDHGIGMPSTVIEHLFDKFYRSHRSRESIAGTGIGLYISKAIVESHGGTISVSSSEGKGSVFTVSLPTYDAIAGKLTSGHNKNVIQRGKASIKNHTMYRG